MSETRLPPDLTPEYGEYSLADLVREYAGKSAVLSGENKPPAERVAPPPPDTVTASPVSAAPPAAESAAEIAERSRKAAMAALGRTLRQYQGGAAPEKNSPGGAAPQKTDAAKPGRPDAPRPKLVPTPAPGEAGPAAPDVSPQRSGSAHGRPRVIRGAEGIITLQYDEGDAPAWAKTAGVRPDTNMPETVARAPSEVPDARPRRVPRRGQAAADLPPAARGEEPPEEPPRMRRRAAFSDAAPDPRDTDGEAYDEYDAYDDDNGYERVPVSERLRQAAALVGERFFAPAVRLAARRIARRQMQEDEAENWPEPVELRQTPELTPGRAAKYYSSLLRPLQLRFRVSLALTAVLVWIGLRLPMLGILRYSVPLQAGVSLILLLAVMVTALDVVAAGFRQLLELKPGAETLAAVSCVLSCVDAALVLLQGGEYLPYCAIGAVSLTAALWGEVLTCRALRRTFRTAAATHTPAVLAVGGEDGSLLHSDREDVDGLVRRSESQDLCRSMYAAAAPFLLLSSLVFSVAAVLGGRGGSFSHVFSALTSVSASFAAFFGFPLPYALASRKLRNTGAALAGFAGCASIGASRRLVIRDEDLFPPGTMRFSEINVAEGLFVGKVVGAAAALMTSAGSGAAALFGELVSRRGYNVPPVEEFAVHEGGGLSGLIGGERVLTGSAGFMNLMGIRLPQNLPTQNSVCVAISGELVGVFVIEYIPVTSVQEALVTLMRGKMRTVFAIRDFNITPRMIGRLFRMPTDNFNFPSFRERYRILSENADDAPPDAVISRTGMLPVVETAEAAGKAYTTCRLSAILSLIGACIGLVIMFLLCRVGSFDTASAGNVLSFMVLWSLPSVILSLGQNR